MARTNSLLRLSDFTIKKCYPNGIQAKVHISKLLLQLNYVVKNLAKGKLDGYHTHEDSLYEPLKEVLSANLPDPNIVTIKNQYPKIKPRKETDLSIRKICQVEKDRKSPDLECTHYIEIKSVFHEEELSAKKIDDDLEKLSDCVSFHEASGLFVLVGLEKDLKRRKRSILNLGKLGEDVYPFSIETYNGKTIWLNPAGGHDTDDPYVFVWEVSPYNDFDERKSTCEYSIFQHQ
ncbi:hypothetical protein CWC33_12310 [Idiomarina sp. X4]|uniref:hypothetical protein n=1 Tax=Idiomarina sp. X4 TaxID=2055892 RepID=UPI000C2835C3|nr:hypothetical protein [Idiomarina sp. X4]ATZ74432.1 hypothetical protein CWC33_12310 [Idiomarina sp. X4]